jgi:hypothetical protein
MHRAAILVDRFQTELARIEQNIDTGIRTELDSASAALASVSLTRRAAEAAANAVYDYLLALLFVDREASHFRNLDTPEAQQDFSQRLTEFVLAAGSVDVTTPPAP